MLTAAGPDHGPISEGSEDRASNRWLVLGLLILVYALSAADRQLISILAEPIRLELHLSDGQLGLLSGAMFALFYTVFGVPFGWLSDRATAFTSSWASACSGAPAPRCAARRRTSCK